MRTIKYTPAIKVTNLEQLARGTGAKFLEVLDDGSSVYVAVKWRNKRPASLADNRFLLIF